MGQYLAFDFGASSGRAVLGKLSDGILKIEDIHRFPSRRIKKRGHIRWNFSYLLQELETGLNLLAGRGIQKLDGVGVDTWGVDFGLLDAQGRLLEDPVCYRDNRTKGMLERLLQHMSRDEIYQRTGIQFMPINTSVQLFALIESGSPLIQKACHLLFMPDLLHYVLSGQIVSEKTIASTSQLINLQTQFWDETLLKLLGIPPHIMPPLIPPGTNLGRMAPLKKGRIRIKADVIVPAGHDTACAVAAVPAADENKWAYLSSGTWSLLGIETNKPVTDNQAQRYNFTNEAGVSNTYRFLRNTMGLWLLQECRRFWKKNGEILGYDQILSLAQSAPEFGPVIDPDDIRFLHPTNMPQAIQSFCRETGQKPPQGKDRLIRCIFESLALKYRYVLDRLQEAAGFRVDILHIVGGGAENALLNQFTADACGVSVMAGPQEATSIGNILIQAAARDEVSTLEEARAVIRRSFPVKSYSPRNITRWNEFYHRHKHLFEK